MSNQPLTRCLEPGCRERVPKGRCAQHTKQRSREHQAKDYQKLYKSRAWTQASREFRMANPICAECDKRGLIVASAVTDHIKSVTNGGEFWDKSNWQALCVNCHNSKTRREQNARSYGFG